MLYSLLTAAGILLLSPYFLIRGLLQGKYLDNLPERLGWKFPPELRAQSLAAAQPKTIWIHAVSVGEVLAALPLAKQLKDRYPARRLVISTTTNTGQQLARERMQFADAIFYFPLDWAGPVRRALSATQPSVVLIVETEIWPNFLRECRRATVPVIFVNGRLSQRSYTGFLRAIAYSGGLLRGFLKKILNDASLFLMQGAEDAERLLALGAPKDRVLVTGNLKYDLALPAETPLSAWLAPELARAQRAPVLIAGSVMANEEPLVLGAFAAVEREFPGALLILAPRKPDQFNNAAAIISQAGRPLVRRSEISLNGSSANPLAKSGNVFLLDSLGELAALYRLADAVFVGGSLVPVGGHNILEPAAFGKVPVYGPFMDNFREIAEAFHDAGASIRVATSQELGAAWLGLLRDPQRAACMGAAARDLVDRNQGATRRVLTHMEKFLDAPGGLP
ncbi:MAG: 3-deoxy-D-manno-octulosonic acid transferase [Acidobacteriia bacterium]|nr:3-deoxy-D-manno-octulosonic acid transferase [Terriglobia bacterium]